LETSGLKVKVNGAGKVVTQSITPGQAIIEGTYVTIQLN